MPIEKFIRCDCHSPEHQFILEYWPDDDPGEMYLSIHLVTWKNILRRAWVAILYILGRRSRYGHWDEVIINREKAIEIGEFLDEFIAGITDNDDTPES